MLTIETKLLNKFSKARLLSSFALILQSACDLKTIIQMLNIKEE